MFLVVYRKHGEPECSTKYKLFYREEPALQFSHTLRGYLWRIRPLAPEDASSAK